MNHLKKVIKNIFLKKKSALYINDNNSALNFHINKDIDIINFLGAKYYIEDNLLYSEFEDIIFKFKRNFVGRGNISDDDYGIYQLICSLLNIINDFNTDYINNNFSDIIININETINIIIEFNTYLINNKLLLKKIGKRIFNIKKELDKIDWNKYLDTNSFLVLYNIIFNIIKMIKVNKDILLTENILTETNYLQLINLIMNKNINLIYKLYNLFIDDNNGLNSNIFSINGIKALFLLKVIKHVHLNKMIHIIDISDIEEILYKIFIKYNTLNKMHMFTCFLLVGAKRYADWIQAFLGKRHYFFVQTTDYYCAYRSLLIKGPVIINSKGPFDKDLDNITVYNFREIPEFDESYIKSNFGIINKGTNEYNINNKKNSLLYSRNKYSDTDFISTPNLSRNYFYKYIKYKTKYNKLKKLII